MIYSIEQNKAENNTMINTMIHVIDQTRGRVFNQDIQTPRSVLKNEAVGRVF